MRHEAEHIVLRDERCLKVELRELKLPVCSKILISHASCDLVVAVDPTDHQELLG